MRCPYCTGEDTSVKDSRPAEDNTVIRRRRACNICGGRFTSYERVQLRELVVIKRDMKRIPFNREKIIRSATVALRKRNIDPEIIEKMVSGIIRQLENKGENEVYSKDIGNLMMNGLRSIDDVAYVRYASVYKDFSNVDDFKDFIGQIDDDDDDGDDKKDDNGNQIKDTFLSETSQTSSTNPSLSDNLKDKDQENNITLFKKQEDFKLDTK